MELTELNQRQVFSAVHMVLAMAMGLQACKSCSARQLVLQEKLRGLMEESSYCLLNVPFLVKVRGGAVPGAGEDSLARCPAAALVGSGLSWLVGRAGGQHRLLFVGAAGDCLLGVSPGGRLLQAAPGVLRSGLERASRRGFEHQLVGPV